MQRRALEAGVALDPGDIDGALDLTRLLAEVGEAEAALGQVERSWPSARARRTGGARHPPALREDAEALRDELLRRLDRGR